MKLAIEYSDTLEVGNEFYENDGDPPSVGISLHDGCTDRCVLSYITREQVEWLRDHLTEVLAS